MSDINQLRNRIDEITIEMIKMLKMRTDISKEIGEIKKNIGKGVTDETREDNLRSKIITVCNELKLNESIGTKFLNFLLNESIKVQSDNKQTHLSIFLKAKAMELEGKKIIHMEVAEPDFQPPKIVRKALEEVFDKGFLKYGNAKGLPVFREALAKYSSEKFGVTVSQDEILVSPGARFSIYSAITTLLNPGDELIVIEPSWPAYKECALNSGIKVRTITTTLEGKWEPTVEQIQKVINDNTKMIILNYPNNPTGSFVEKSKIDFLAEELKKHPHVAILSDEIYSRQIYDGKEMPTFFNYPDLQDRLIVLDGWSKAYSMTGWRMGWSVWPEKLIPHITKLAINSFSCVNAPSQFAGIAALDGPDDPIHEMMKKFDQRRKLIHKGLNDLPGVTCSLPGGAFYAFPNISSFGLSSEEFADLMLEKANVALLPGSNFGSQGEGFVRMVYASSESNIKRALERVADVCHQLSGRV